MQRLPIMQPAFHPIPLHPGESGPSQQFASMDTAFATSTAPSVADPLSRGVAKLLDLLLAAALARLFWPIGWFAAVTYLLIADGLGSGPSVGKRVIGLIVRTSLGRRCGLRESILRNMPLAVPFGIWALLLHGGWLMTTAGWLMLLGAVGVEALFLAGNPQGRRLGDDVADTFVIGDARSIEASGRSEG